MSTRREICLVAPWRIGLGAISARVYGRQRMREAAEEGLPCLCSVALHRLGDKLGACFPAHCYDCWPLGIFRNPFSEPVFRDRAIAPSRPSLVSPVDYVVLTSQHKSGLVLGKCHHPVFCQTMNGVYCNIRTP